MHLASLRNLSSVFAPAVLLVLACGPASITHDAGAGTGSTSADGGSGGGFTDTDSSGTGATDPGCGVVQLADVAQGIGGFVVDGEAEENGSGWSVGGAGDVNGDGLADVVVGAPGTLDGYGIPSADRAYVVFGKTDTAAVSLRDTTLGVGGFVLDGDRSGLGSSVDAAGDVNGDGLADVVVGAPWGGPVGGARDGGAQRDSDGGPGRASVVFGKADTDRVSVGDLARGIGGFAVDAEPEAGRTGTATSHAGDVNGDGLADIVVGAPWASPNGVDDSGRTYVVFGEARTDSVQLADVADGIGGFAMDGEAEHDQSGWSVSGAGDVNGDGLDDVVVAAWRADPGGVHVAGRTYVVFGKADPDKVLLADVALGVGGFALDGEAEGDRSGWSVSGAGDVNGDGHPDLAVGAPFAAPNGSDSGRTYVVFGKAGTDKVQLADVARGIGGFAMDGEREDDESGQAVSGAGDVNGDGRADLIVGAPGASPHGSISGRTYVVFGKADTDKVRLADVAEGIGGFVLDGEAADHELGRSVSGAGDVNGDGVPDIVVGAPYASPNALLSGRTYVVFGGDFSCAGG